MPEEMQEYKVILTWEAIYDVTDITDYIEAEFGQARADRFQDDIKKCLRHLNPLAPIHGGIRGSFFYRFPA